MLTRQRGDQVCDEINIPTPEDFGLAADLFLVSGHQEQEMNLLDKGKHKSLLSFEIKLK